MSRESKILTAILVVVVGGMIGLFMLMGGGSDKTTDVKDAGKLTRAASHIQGSGKVQLIEFGDYQCPSCGAAYPIIKQIQADYPDVQLVFRNFPLVSLHPNAMKAAEAAEAAGKQDKYFEMHDALYANQKAWSTATDPVELFASYAKSIGIDTNMLKSDIQNSAYQAIIDTDMADGEALGVNATPTLYVGGKKLAAFDYATIRDAVVAAGATPAASPTPAQ